MATQNTIKKLIFPDGGELAISDDDGSSFHGLGVLEAGVEMTYNFDKIEEETGNSGKTCARAKNETLALAPSPLQSFNLPTLEKIGGGLFTNTAIAGTPVPGATQTAASGGWLFNKLILIENQNYDVSAITVNSVTGGTDGILVEDTDYYIGQNAKGEYGIFIIDSANVTTETQDMVIDYDYTPSAGNVMTAGKSSTILSRYIMRFRHYTNDAQTEWDIELFAYGTDVDSGMAINFKGSNEEGKDNITVSFTSNLDTSRASGSQLFQLTIKDAALTDC